VCAPRQQADACFAGAQALDCSVRALHVLLLHTAAAQLQLGDVEDDFQQFIEVCAPAESAGCLLAVPERPDARA
jgi:hypothetical protein